MNSSPNHENDRTPESPANSRFSQPAPQHVRHRDAQPTQSNMYGEAHGIPSGTMQNGRAHHFTGSHASYWYMGSPHPARGPVFGQPNSFNGGWAPRPPCMDDWKASQRKNDTLTKCTGDISKHGMWAKRMIDHFCLSHNSLEELIERS